MSVVEMGTAMNMDDLAIKGIEEARVLLDNLEHLLLARRAGRLAEGV